MCTYAGCFHKSTVSNVHDLHRCLRSECFPYYGYVHLAFRLFSDTTILPQSAQPEGRAAGALLPPDPRQARVPQYGRLRAETLRARRQAI